MDGASFVLWKGLDMRRICMAFLALLPLACAQLKPTCTRAPTDRPAPCPEPIENLEQLARMSEGELASLYVNSSPGLLPTGYTPGIAIFNPGTASAEPLARLIRNTAWQGKYFPNPTTMTNRAFGLKMISADVSLGNSWYDGQPSLIFDYCERSVLAHNHRDEVREISPGIYLGIMFRKGLTNPKLVSWFALDARKCAE